MEEKKRFKYSEDELLEKILNDKNIFPISSSKENLMNKKLDYKVLMLMTFLSNRQTDENMYETGCEETWRYLYRNKLTEYQDLVESLSKTKLNSIFKTIKKMEKLDCNVLNVRKTEANEIVYDINYATNNREYVVIETKIMETLIHSFNSNAIKIYIILRYMCRNGERQITQDWILRQIGMSCKSHNNLQMITNITDELACGGYINKRTINNSSNKRVNYYEVNSKDEWISIRNKNKNRNM